MSLKDKLAKKTEGLVAAAGNIPAGASGKPSVARTAPGQMLAFREHMRESSSKVVELATKVAELQKGTPVLDLPADVVHPSKWANRHEASFSSANFESLKRDIAAAGGNVQPIKVRPIPDRIGHYEIVFGHRRHRACRDLGLPVRASVVELNDERLFVEMDAENRSRDDLSAWEQGVMYQRALESRLFPSLRQLAVAIGVDVGNASKAIAIAQLPEAVLGAFPSPTEVQFRWGKPLSDALQRDPEGVVARANVIRALTVKPTAAAVFRQIVDSTSVGSSSERAATKKDVSLSWAGDGSLTVRIPSGWLERDREAELLAALVSLRKS